MLPIGNEIVGRGIVPPAYVNKYPHISRTVPRIYNILRQLPIGADRNLYQNSHFELEARFGTIQNDGKHTFKPGVSLEFLQSSLQTVSTFTGWHPQSTDWNETHDFYYELPPDPEDLRGQGQLVRTSVSFDQKFKTEVTSTTTTTSLEESTPPQHGVTHMCKQLRDKQDFKYHSVSPSASWMQQLPSGLDVRVSLNLEETVPLNSVPSRVNVNPPSASSSATTSNRESYLKYVRIKNRKSFVYQPDDAPHPIWSIDFTKSWSGATYTQAELRQKANETLYEIEVECLDPYAYMSAAPKDLWYLATSLMLKMRDFVGTSTPFYWDQMYKYGGM